MTVLINRRGVWLIQMIIWRGGGGIHRLKIIYRYDGRKEHNIPYYTHKTNTTSTCAWHWRCVGIDQLYGILAFEWARVGLQGTSCCREPAYERSRIGVLFWKGSWFMIFGIVEQGKLDTKGAFCWYSERVCIDLESVQNIHHKTDWAENYPLHTARCLNLTQDIL